MVTTAFPEILTARSVPLPAAGPLLIATDGSDESDAAFAIAARLSESRGAEAQVLAVLEPLPVLAHDLDVPAWVKELNATRHDELAARAKRQIRDHAALGWSLDIREGPPAVEIARAARAQKASFVIVGIGKHALTDRLFGDETALQLLRLCDTPVLAVPPGFTTLAHRVVFASDFSEASIRAFNAALPLLKEDATIYLAHAVPRFVQLSGAWDSIQQSYLDSLEREFTHLRETLDIPPTMTVETITLKGHPARELLDLAEASKADLIVCGTHGLGFMSRMLLGSVATEMLRGATCPILVVPQPRPLLGRNAVAERRASSAETRSIDLPPAEYPDRLKLFTERNAGRHCRIEVDDPELGAQAQVLDYPFLGAAFDRRDQRVEIMVGEPDGAHHLTRGIAGVTGISLVVDDRGRDRVLRVQHGEGQTFVWLEQK
jgi:nucleotide-binding universal stress UspA family protein